MLHEIQPGDFMIITVPIGVSKSGLKDHWNDVMKSGVGVHFVHSTNATETSVHVIRAKKADKYSLCGKPGCIGPGCIECAVCSQIRSGEWPTWRRVDKDPDPPHGVQVLVFGTHGSMFTGVWSTALRDHVTHWMPLPEGPIAPTRESDHP